MIDQEIRDALKVDPSPEFVARVRTRIASEPAPSAWRWSWALAAGGAVAAVVIGAMVMSPAREKAVVAPLTQAADSSPASESPKGPAAQPLSAPGVRAYGPANAGLKLHATSHAANQQGPVLSPTDILLDPAETRALQRLIAQTRDGSIDLAAVARASTPAAMELAPIEDLVISPITIEPLAESGQGERP